MQSISRSGYSWRDQTSALTTFFYHLIFSTTFAVANSRFLLHFTGKFRRFWLVHFRRQYVQNQLLTRRGDCRQCGTCCNLLFTCPMLTKQGRCFVYGSCRPESCKVFPIDQRDIDEVSFCGSCCGYYFEMKDSSKVHEITRH